MSTSTVAGNTGLQVPGGRALLGAVVVAGVAFAAEAVASVVVDARIGYHSLNVVLNIALLVACANLALSGKDVVGRAGVSGGWATALIGRLT